MNKHIGKYLPESMVAYKRNHIKAKKILVYVEGHKKKMNGRIDNDKGKGRPKISELEGFSNRIHALVFQFYF